MTEFNCISKNINSNNGQPVWIASQSSLFWVDAAHKRLYQYHEPSKGISFCGLDAPILSLSPRINNGFIATLEDGIGFYDMQSRKVSYISKPEPFATNSQTIPGVIDKFGNHWSFTHPENDQHHGNLYQLSSADMHMQRMSQENWHCSAPPAFSKNGDRLYQSCGSNRNIYVTSLNADGQPISTDSFCRISKSEGYPHGLCVDKEDHLWVCHRESGIISRFSTQGERVDKLRLATPGFKFCTFGGEELDILFAVTADIHETSSERRKIVYGNAIMSCKPGVSGLELNRFAG